MRQKKLYLENGYLDFRQIVDDEYPIALLIGGRATGKTYGALEHGKLYFDECCRPFVYMRRTQKKADLVATDVFNPFRPLNRDKGWSVYPSQIAKGVNGFYNMVDTEDGRRPVGDPVGIIAALSTFSNLRGIDGSNVDIVYLDEFIKEDTEKAIKNESFALLNVYETLNRNRELTGEPPLKMVCMSNSNAIDNDIFVGLGLVQHAEKMILTGKNQFYLPDRHIALYNLTDSPISVKKAGTTIYQADQGGRFTDMAIRSKYADYDPVGVKSEPIIEYKMLCKIGELCIYKHKSDTKYYCTFHQSGTAPEYAFTDVDKIRFLRKYDHLWNAYLSGKMSFETFYCKKLFENVFI